MKNRFSYLSVALVLVMVFCAACEPKQSAEPKPSAARSEGAYANVGKSRISTYSEMEPGKGPKVVGVSFPSAALKDLPTSHSAERHCTRGRTQYIRRSAAKHARQQRHHRKGRRGREMEPIGHPARAGVPAGRTAAGYAGASQAHGFAPASFRNAASPASDTSTHLLSGAAPST